MYVKLLGAVREGAELYRRDTAPTKSPFAYHGEKGRERSQLLIKHLKLSSTDVSDKILLLLRYLNKSVKASEFPGLSRQEINQLNQGRNYPRSLRMYVWRSVVGAVKKHSGDEPYGSNIDVNWLKNQVGNTKDKRKNSIKYAKVESTWAVSVMDWLDANPHFGGKLKAYTNAFLDIYLKQKMGKHIRFRFEPQKARDLKAVLATADASKLFDCCYAQMAYKDAFEGYVTEKLKELANAQQPNRAPLDKYMEVREAAMFRDRGRTEVSSRLKESMLNPHAGIMATEHTAPGLKDRFAQPISHGKAGFKKDTGPVAKTFEVANIPFIGGASGTMAYVCAYLMYLYDPTKENQDERETLIAIATAGLVAAGQHSLVEAMAVAQLYGNYIDASIPRIDRLIEAHEGIPDEGTNPYRNFLAKFSDYIVRYNIPRVNLHV